MEEVKITPLGLLSSLLKLYTWSWAAYILRRWFYFTGYQSIWKFAAKNKKIFLLVLVLWGKEVSLLKPHSLKFSMFNHGQIRKSKYRDLILVPRKLTFEAVHQPSWMASLPSWDVVVSDSQQSSCQGWMLGGGVAVYDMQSPEKNYFLKEGKSGTQGSQDKPFVVKRIF